MKNIKKFLLLAFIAFTFSACNNNVENSSSENNSVNNESIKSTYTIKFDVNIPPKNSTTTIFISDETLTQYTNILFVSTAKVEDITLEKNAKAQLPSYNYGYKIYNNNTAEELAEKIFYCWNTKADGSGTDYKAGESFNFSEDITLYGKWIDRNPSTEKTETDDDDNTSTTLDIATTKEYSMKVNDTIQLKSSLENGSYYVQSGRTSISIDSNDILTANAIGTAIVKFTSEDSSKSYYCNISVTAEGFEGSAVENLLLGTWTTSGSSYKGTLTLNDNMTGHIKTYLSSNVIYDTDFKWSAGETGTTSQKTKYLEIKNTGFSALDCDHTLTNFTTTSFIMNGYLSFGFPSTTTWDKTN